MFTRFKKTPAEPEQDYAVGHALVTDDGVWLLYRYTPVEWSSLDDAGRMAALNAYTRLLAALVGREIQEWVLPESFPAPAYYAGMMARYPGSGPAFTEMVESAARAIIGSHVHRAFLGVRLSDKRLPAGTVEAAVRRADLLPDDHRDQTSWGRLVQQIDQAVAGHAEPLTRRQIDALVAATSAPGLPVGASSVEASSPSPYATTVELHGISDGEPVESHVQMLRAATHHDREDTAQWPVLAWAQTLPHHVVATRRGHLIDAQELVKETALIERRSRSTTRHDVESGYSERGEVEKAADRAAQVRTELVTGGHTRHRFRGHLRFAVVAPSRDAVIEAGRSVVSDATAGGEAGGILAELTVNYGQLSDAAQLRPGVRWTLLAHETQQSLAAAACALPQASQSAGDVTGWVVGPMGDSGDVYIHDLWGAARPNQSKLHVLLGTMGSGKSHTAGLAFGFASRLTRRGSGIKTTVNDPSGNLAHLAQLSWVGADARVIEVTAGGQDGMLMPHFLVDDPVREDYQLDHEYTDAMRERAAERAQLAEDLIMSLVPWSVRERDEGELAEVIADAVAAAGAAYGTHSREILSALDAQGDYGKRLAARLRRRADTSVGALVLPPGPMSKRAEAALTSDAHITFVSAPGLSLPSADVSRRAWTKVQQDSEPLMLAMSWLAARTALSGPSGRGADPKLHIDDELGLSAGGAYGAFLSRMIVETRRRNLSALFAFQTMSMLQQLPNAEVDSLIGPRFIGRCSGTTARLADQMLLDGRWESALPDLPPGGFVVKGWDGKARLVQVETDYHSRELLGILDTTPERAEESLQGEFGAIR